MSEPQPSDEYRQFIDGLVPLGEAQTRGQDSPFESLLSRLTRRTQGAAGWPASLYGGGLLLAAAALGALMPFSATGSFWRIGRDSMEQMLAAGNGAALPLALAGVGLLLIGALATLWRGPLSEPVLIAQPFIGGAGIAGIGVLWIGLLAFAVVNLIVLLLIIVAYVVAAILIVAVLIGMLLGLADQ